MKTNKERLNDIFDRLGTISYIKLENPGDRSLHGSGDLFYGRASEKS